MSNVKIKLVSMKSIRTSGWSQNMILSLYVKSRIRIVFKHIFRKKILIGGIKMRAGEFRETMCIVRRENKK